MEALLSRPFIKIVLSLFLALLAAGPAKAASTCDHVTLPLNFDSLGLPHIDLEIAGHSQSALLDLGAEAALYLTRDMVIKSHALTYTGDAQLQQDLAGHQQVPWLFTIKHFQIECMSFNQISGAELLPWGLTLGQVKRPDDKIIIGRDFFKGKVLEISYLFSSLTIRQPKAAPGPEFEPMTMDANGIAIPAKTLSKTYQMVLDTGASFSFIRPKSVPKGEQIRPCHYPLGQVQCRLLDRPLLVGHKAFSSQFLIYPVSANFQRDGILGADFFKQYDVDIDFKHRAIRLIKT